VQVEDNGEAALLVVCTSIITKLVVSVSAEVHLNEDWLFIQLGEKAGDTTRWILETGVSNHDW
jgi:hypothetical protein